MLLSVICNYLDSGCLPTARVSIEHEAHGVRDASLLLPGFIVSEEVYSFHNVLFPWIEHICKRFARFEPELRIV